jgi:hypothetical protein
MWTSERPQRVGLAALLLAAAACATGGGTISPPVLKGYSNDVARRATGGVQPLIVIGAPPDGASAATVASRLSAPGFYPRTRYDIVSAAPEGLVTVIAFGGGPACEPTERGPASDFTVSAAICDRGVALSSTTLRSDGIAGPSSEGYDAAMTRLMNAILPRLKTTKQRTDD